MSSIYLPKQVGICAWHALSTYKDHKFNDPSAIKEQYDYIIVGAGFAGVSCAHEIARLEPQSTILLLDALEIGDNSSGRNAGFVSHIQIAKAMVGNHKFSDDDQKWLMRLNRIVIDRILEIKEEHKLNFQWRHDGMYKAVRESRNIKAMHEVEEVFKKLNLDYKIFEGDELCERLGTDFYKKALYIKENYLNNPAEAIRALAKALPNNVTVVEKTAVNKIEDGESPAIEIQAGLRIECKKIVIAANAFIKHFYHKATANLTAINSFAAVTRELNEEELKNFKDVEPWGITALHPAGATVRYTPYKRLFIRTDIAYAHKLNTTEDRMYKAQQMLRLGFERRFKSLSHVNFEYVWGGLISFTGNTLPIFGEVAHNVFACTTSDGTGVTRASIVGTYTAHLMCNKESKELAYIKANYHASYLPPEPFRGIGARFSIALRNFEAGEEF